MCAALQLTICMLFPVILLSFLLLLVLSLSCPRFLPCRTRRIICIHLRQTSCVFVTTVS